MLNPDFVKGDAIFVTVHYCKEHSSSSYNSVVSKTFSRSEYKKISKLSPAVNSHFKMS